VRSTAVDAVKENAKAIAGLVGGVATAITTVYAPDTPVGHFATVVAVVATAVGVWAVPNADTEGE
jgi:hypothetical protein